VPLAANLPNSVKNGFFNLVGLEESEKGGRAEKGQGRGCGRTEKRKGSDPGLKSWHGERLSGLAGKGEPGKKERKRKPKLIRRGRHQKSIGGRGPSTGIVRTGGGFGEAVPPRGA